MAKGKRMTESPGETGQNNASYIKYLLRSELQNHREKLIYLIFSGE